jgi:hypothetical protein
MTCLAANRALLENRLTHEELAPLLVRHASLPPPTSA